MRYRTLVDRYIGVWNLDLDARRAAIDEVFTVDLSYTDPSIALRGRESLDRYIGMTRRRFAGAFASVPERVDGHHAQVRFGWTCTAPGGEQLAAGFDVALFDGERIAAVYGFFE